jgi:hypothetical protein
MTAVTVLQNVRMIDSWLDPLDMLESAAELRPDTARGQEQNGALNRAAAPRASSYSRNMQTGRAPALRGQFPPCSDPLGTTTMPSGPLRQKHVTDADVRADGYTRTQDCKRQFSVSW